MSDNNKSTKTECSSMIFCLLFTLSIQCHRMEEGNYFRIVNPENFEIISFTLSDLCSDIQYIKLDTGIIFGDILDIQIVKNRIYLKTRQPLGYVVYDFSGKFLSSIGSYGNGPGEYSTYSTFTVDPGGKNVYIFDNHKGVSVFSANYQFINKFPLSEEIKNCDIFALANDKLLFTQGNTEGNSEFKWTVTNKFGNIIYSKINTIFFKKKVSGSGPGPSQIVYTCDTCFNYFEHYNDTIFQICSNSFKVHAIFDLGEDRFTPEIAKKEDLRNSKKKYFIPFNVYETDKFMFIHYAFYGFKLALLNKETGKMNIIKTGFGNRNIINDFDSGLSILPISGYENYLIGFIIPVDLKNHIASDAFKNSTPKFPEKKKELEKLANSLNENDNPVLMLVKIKE